MKVTNKIKIILNKLFSMKIIKYLLIPLLLLFLWLSFSLFFSLKESFTVLTFNNDKVDKNSTITKLYKDKIISGSFKAKNNNLGIVTIKIGKVLYTEYEKQDFIVFKIREIGKKNWLSENTYNSGSFSQNNTFPIGFKEQHNSKDKTYEVEIHSLKGNVNNAIEIVTQNNNPIYQTKYKFSKDEIFENKNTVWNFIQYKLISFFTNREALYSSFIYLLPLLLYLSWIFLPIQIYINKLGKFTIAIILLILFDVIYLKFIFTGIMVGLISLWIYLLYKNKSKSNVTFRLAFLLLLLSVASIYFNLGFSIDKATTYAYLFLIIGIIQSMRENEVLRGKTKKRNLFQKRR
jgi:hypothetical protein